MTITDPRQVAHLRERAERAQKAGGPLAVDTPILLDLISHWEETVELSVIDPPPPPM